MRKIVIPILLLGYLFAGENPLSKINTDIRDGIIDPAAGLELKVKALLDSESLPVKYQSTDFEPHRCGAGILDEAWQSRESLSLETNRMLNNIGVSSSVSRNSYTYGHFTINYETSGTHAPSLYDGDSNGTPDYIESMGQYFEDAFTYITSTVAFNNPLDYVSTNNFIVSVEELSDDGILGYVPGNSYHLIWMDNDLSDRYLKLTSVHELHHLVQHTYNITSPWYKECTSMWIEEKMYDNLDGYQGYDQAFQQAPQNSLDYFESGGLYQYGSILWNLYISENFGDLAVKTVWEQGSGNAITAAASFFQANGSNFDSEFAQFNVWNYLTGYRANGTHPSGQYEEANNISLATNTQIFTGEIAGYTPDDGDKPDHLGTNYININRGTDLSNNLLIEFDGINTADWNVEVITRAGSTYDSFILNTDAEGDGFLVINDWPTYTNIILVPSVLTRTGANFSYIVDATPIDNVIFQDHLAYEALGEDIYLDPGDTIEVVVGYTNYGEQLTNLVSTISTSTPGVTMIDSTFDIASINSAGSMINSISPFRIAISDSITASTIEFLIELVQGTEILISEPFDINIGITDILVVDDDNNGDSETSVVEILNQDNSRFEIINGAAMQLDELSLDMRELVIWNTGSVSSDALSAEEQQALIGYLESGKRLLLMGDHLASQLAGTSLLEDYLNFEYSQSSSGGWLKGTNADPIGISNLNWAMLNLDFTGVDMVRLNGDPRGHISYYLGIDESVGGILRFSSQDYTAVLASFDINDITSTTASFKTGTELFSDVIAYLQEPAQFPAVPALVSPGADAVIALSTESDSVIFEWPDTSNVSGLIISRGQEDIVPLLSFDVESTTSLGISYQELVDTLGYVSDEALSWCVYSAADGEVSVSELRPFSLTTTEVVSAAENTNLPAAFMVSSNYPNPFNPVTTVDIHLPELSFVSAVVYDISGRKIAELVNSSIPAGVFQVKWDGRDSRSNQLASGVYFLQVKAGKFIHSQKMVLVK